MRHIKWMGALLLTVIWHGQMNAVSGARVEGSTFDNRLLPQPAALRSMDGEFVVAPDFAVRFDGPSDVRLQSAVGRLMAALHDKAGVGLPSSTASNPANAALTIKVHSAGSAIPTAEDDESYHLRVATNGITLEAPTDYGAIHGLETLLQLVQPSQSRFVLPAVEIDDSPRFRWRGLLVDCSRHFEPVAEIKRTLDAMEIVKLNVFHWHLTDDEGVRVESKVFPKLTQIGSDGLFYTQQEIRDIVAYANDRGIRVVPEFEMPGHSTAWLLAYPELSSGNAPTGIRRQFGIAPYAMDPTRDETYQFIDRFLAEMVTLFPDAYVHIGGDETSAPDWKTSPRIQAFMHAHDLKDSAALQAYFNQRILKILTRLNRHMIGWDEIFNPALPRDVLIQTWRGEASIATSSAEGYQGILSAGYYLDGMQSAETHYLVDPAPSQAALTAKQRSLILGGEVAMWGEFVNPETLDSRIWPRAAAIAERLWSPESVRDIDDMYRRLDAVSVQLEGLGLQHVTHQDVALRTLVGTEDVSDLRTFASVLEPDSFAMRFGRNQASQLDPLNHLSDAVRPDPPARREFDRLTKAYLKAPQHSSAEQHALEAYFRALAGCSAAVKRQASTAPGLQEIQTRAGQLPELARIGLESVDALAAGTVMSAEWHTHATALIAEAEKSSGNVHFVFLGPLKALVLAAKS